MTDNGYGHIGRIPNFGQRQPNKPVMAEPPACIQNAMMTKDKKPFTYTPGGLDLSQIRTPSMARRLARQRSQEDQEQAYQQQQGYQQQPQNMQKNGPPPPPPFQGAPPPPPPPPLVIQTLSPNQAKPESIVRPMGERPEIVIPENPIGMLRKTNSPYHWEQEQAEKEKLGNTPKFVEKVQSPAMQQPPPTTFSQHPPALFTPQPPVRQNYPYEGAATQMPESPVHKPEPQYPSKHSQSPLFSPTPTRDFLQRQDSQFNKSPAPFGSPSSPQVNESPISGGTNNAWHQPENYQSPVYSSSSQQRSPFSSANSGRSTQYTPSVIQSPIYKNESPAYHTLPRSSPKVQNNYANHGQSPQGNMFNNTIFNNVQRSEQKTENPKVDPNNPTPWRANTLSQQTPRYEQKSSEPSKSYNPLKYNTTEPMQQTVQQNHRIQNHENQFNPNNQWAPENQINNQNQYLNQSQRNQPNQWGQYKQNDWNNKHEDDASNEARYQTHMTLPVTPKRHQQQYEPERHQSQPPQPKKEAVYVTQEPVYFHNPDSPKYIPPWVKTQKEKTPPPEWVQRPLDGKKSLTRELASPPGDNERSDPEWVQKSIDMRSAQRELSSPPPMQQSTLPHWSTRPSENRKSVPRDTQTVNYVGQNGHGNDGSRMIPIQIENNQPDSRPHLKVMIDMHPQNPQMQPQALPPYSQPTQRIIRVLSPQLVHLDQQEKSMQPDLPSLSQQPKTRIIPIQVEGGSSDAPNRRIFYHKFTADGPPRQSKAFRVLQVITGTQDDDNLDNMKDTFGFCNL